MTGKEDFIVPRESIDPSLLAARTWEVLDLRNDFDILDTVVLRESIDPDRRRSCGF